MLPENTGVASSLLLASFMFSETTNPNFTLVTVSFLLDF